MFDRLSVRVVAGALLWSTALILISIAYHGRLFGMKSGVEDIPYMNSLIGCTVSGGFFGVFFGGCANIPRHPILVNVFSAIGFIFGVVLAPSLSMVRWSASIAPWANGLVALYALGCIAAIVGAIVSKTAIRGMAHSEAPKEADSSSASSESVSS